MSAWVDVILHAIASQAIVCHASTFSLTEMKTPAKIIKFYNSTRWRRFQKYIRSKYHGLCQECGKAGWEVHHIIPLTYTNVDDDQIALGEDNVTLLCTSCHNAQRQEESYVRRDVTFDADGNLIKKGTPHR